MEIFHCACEGGIRYATRTNTIALIVNNTKDGLPNVWNNGILEFAGRPLKADSELRGANARLGQFWAGQGDVFVFVVDHPGQYKYAGQARGIGAIETRRYGCISYPVFPLVLEKDKSPIK